MQTSLELTFCSYFTLLYAKYDGSLCALINISYAIIFAIMLCMFPIVTVIFYRVEFPRFRKISFVNVQEDSYRHSRSVFYHKNHLLWQKRFETLFNEFYKSEEKDIIEMILILK